MNTDYDYTLRLSQTLALQLVDQQTDAGQTILNSQMKGVYRQPADFIIAKINWATYTVEVLKKIFGVGAHVEAFERQVIQSTDYRSLLEQCQGMFDQLQAGLSILQYSRLDIETWLPGQASAASDDLKLLLSHFHTVALQLLHRREQRETLKIVDGYDVQDLLHALLRIFFDDIRPEEATPSYAARTSRVDFFLKREGIIVEVKMAREGLGGREVGEQLINDIARYRHLPGCNRLVCFVYDPDFHIVNPAGLQADLSRDEEGFIVEVFIVPTPH